MDKIKFIHKIKESNNPEKEKLFLNFCDALIAEKESGVLREEQVGYDVCGVGLSSSTTINSPLDRLISHACQMEILRETSIGCGISLSDTWTQENADAYKENEWKEFCVLLEDVKKTFR
jgi:hypothetical protein